MPEDPAAYARRAIAHMRDRDAKAGLPARTQEEYEFELTSWLQRGYTEIEDAG
jgi:hypothetical protein